MAKDVKFNIKLKIDGKKAIVQASANVKELTRELGVTEDKGRHFGETTRDFAAISTVVQNAISGLQNITGLLLHIQHPMPCKCRQRWAGNCYASYGEQDTGRERLGQRAATTGRDRRRDSASRHPVANHVRLNTAETVDNVITLITNAF